MLSYHNDPNIKVNILQKLKTHYAADEIVKGVYWENGKGCAVGCTIEVNDHTLYPKLFGINEELAYLEDRIFENLPNDLAKEWPIKFMEAIPVGKDLSNVWPRFAVWLLIDKKYGVLQYVKKNEMREAIYEVAFLYQKSISEIVTKEEWEEAKNTVVNTAFSYIASSNVATTDATVAYAVAAAAYHTAAADYADAAHAAAVTATFFSFTKEEHFIAQAEKLLKLFELLH